MTDISVQKLTRGKGNTDKDFPPHFLPGLRAAGSMLHETGLSETVMCLGKTASG